MTKLWKKNFEINKEIEKFTVGNDYLLDKKLIKFDCLASIAHAKMLYKIKILKKHELDKLEKILKQIINLDSKNKFKIKVDDEDCHTAIENYLTKKLGFIGKKIHTARSRNDQVLTALRLYMKNELLEIKKLSLDLIETLIKFAKKNEFVPMPGYTHMQKAMPSSIGLWIMSFAESMSDNIKLIDNAFDLTNQSPLGSGAGYGTNIFIDREYTAKLLGFGKVQNNVLYVQNSRGKIELINIFALVNIMNDLSKLASDLLLFSMGEFSFFSLPKEFCTGSSIMPQKNNYDLLELIRGKSSKISANYYEINNIIQKLVSGYNRDFQLIKEPLISSFETTKECLNITLLYMNNLKVNKDKLIKGCTSELFATDEVNKLVMKGVPFRDAYKNVADNLDKLEKHDPIINIKSKKSVGSTGCLGMNRLLSIIKEEKIRLKNEN